MMVCQPSEIGVPCTQISVATTAPTSTTLPVTTAVTASGYCTTKNGTVPANASGRSVTISFNPL